MFLKKRQAEKQTENSIHEVTYAKCLDELWEMQDDIFASYKNIYYYNNILEILSNSSDYRNKIITLKEHEQYKLNTLLQTYEEKEQNTLIYKEHHANEISNMTKPLTVLSVLSFCETRILKN